MEIEKINYDVLIVGAGPSGLSAAIKLKQLASENHSKLRSIRQQRGSDGKLQSILTDDEEDDVVQD